MYPVRDTLFDRKRSMPASAKISRDARTGARRENRRIAELPAFGSAHGTKLRPHLESSLFIVAPPSAKAGQIPGTRVPLMHKTSSNAAGPPFKYL